MVLATLRERRHIYEERPVQGASFCRITSSIQPYAQTTDDFANGANVETKRRGA